MIRIIAGVYGYKENGVIIPKDSNSAPFSLEPKREAELVERGIAEYANVVISGNAQSDVFNAEQTAERKEKVEYDEKMKLSELQELAAEYGLDANEMRAKADVIKLLDDYFAEDDGELPPSFGAMDPVE